FACVTETLRRQAMATRHDVRPIRDARPHKRLFDITTHALFSTRWRTIERQIAALRTEQQLIARKLAINAQTLERRADGPLAALEAIVRRRVNHVHAEFDGAHDRIGVTLIRRFIRRPQIRAYADGRAPQLLLVAKMVLGGRFAQAFTITRRAFSRTVAIDGHSSKR